MNDTTKILLHIAKHETGCTSRALSHLVHDSNRRRQITRRLKERGWIDSTGGVRRTGNRWMLTAAGNAAIARGWSARIEFALFDAGISNREFARRVAASSSVAEATVMQVLGGQTMDPRRSTWAAIESELEKLTIDTLS